MRLQLTIKKSIISAALLIVLVSINNYIIIEKWRSVLKEEMQFEASLRNQVASELEEVIYSTSEVNLRKSPILKTAIRKLRTRTSGEKLGRSESTRSLIFSAAPCKQDDIEDGWNSCRPQRVLTKVWPYVWEYIWNKTDQCQMNLSEVTVLLNPSRNSDIKEISSLISSVKNTHNYVRILVAVEYDDEKKLRELLPWSEEEIRIIGFPSISSENYRWKELINNAQTSMILVGRDLDYFGTWSDLERSVSLLKKYSKNLLAVGGSSRLRDGRWKIGCYQIAIKYYVFKYENGYYHSTCEDCMICSYLRGPFLTLKKHFETYPFQEDISLGFLKWFHDIGHNRMSLSCPDIMYLTTENDSTFESVEGSFEDWKELSHHLEFQSVQTDRRVKSLYRLTCSDAKLSCSPRSTAHSFLLPYCCTLRYNFISAMLEEMSKQLGLKYELDSGTLLGAAKINNFLPWDIDGDIYMRTEDIIKYFGRDGEGRKILVKKGMRVTSVEDDNYWDRGAKYFKIYFDGAEIEIMGRRELSEGECSKYYREGGCHNQTRVKVGKTWCKSHANPGRYLRFRYGPGYLRHTHSWRFLPNQTDSFSKYTKSGQWNLCENPGHHSCLDSYDGDGNLDWVPANYPGNE